MHFHWYMLSFIFPLITLKFHVKVLHLSGNSSAGKNKPTYTIMLFLWHLLQDFIKFLLQSKHYIPLIADTNWFAGNMIR